VSDFLGAESTNRNRGPIRRSHSGQEVLDMTSELPKQYDPHEAQQRWLALWDDKGYFHSRPDPTREMFSIVIPPPNVTGALHMGHALNKNLQEFLKRRHRASGVISLW